MSIKTNYDFNGLNIQDAIIRIDRLWGSSREGWTSLVGVYIEKAVPAIDEVTEERVVPATETQPETTETVVVTEAKPAGSQLQKLTEFNHSASYVKDENGYISLYNSLTEKFGGVQVSVSEVEGQVQTTVRAVTARQARLQLAKINLLTQVETLVDTLGAEAKINWEYASYVQIDNPLIEAVKLSLEMSDEQIQTMFNEASKL